MNKDGAIAKLRRIQNALDMIASILQDSESDIAQLPAQEVQALKLEIRKAVICVANLKRSAGEGDKQ